MCNFDTVLLDGFMVSENIKSLFRYHFVGAMVDRWALKIVFPPKWRMIEKQ